MYSYIGPEPLRTNIPLLPATRKSTASSSAQSPSTTPNGLPMPPEFANAFQLDIVSALRGHDHNFMTRSAVADAISAIANEEHKLQLIDFLAAEQGAIAVTLENNACKLFECTPGELFVLGSRISCEDGSSLEQQQFLKKLVRLFQTTLHKIIPNAFGMLYPLQQFDSTFQIREIILHYFRDRVILSLLDNFHFSQSLFEENGELEAELRQMFLLINLDIRDESDESECFQMILDDFLGKKCEQTSHKNSTCSQDDSMPNPSRKVGIFTKQSSTRGRRFYRAARSTANSVDIPSSDATQLDAIKMPTAQQRNRKSFSPSPKLFMANEEAKKEIIAEEQLLLCKERSRTMPSKSVTFWDDETIVDV